MFRRVIGLAMVVGGTMLTALLVMEMANSDITLNGVTIVTFTAGALVAGVGLNVWPDKG
jgi:hypothetical protein